MRSFYVFLVVSVLCVSPTKLQAKEDIYSGNYWLNQCSDSEDLHKTTFCVGLVVGLRMMTGTFLAGNTFFEIGGDLIPVQPSCEPEGVTNGQVRDVYVAYLKNHPERRHEPAQGLWINAMQEAFPCK